MSSRRQVRELGGFRDVRDLVVSPDGRMVAVALGDADRIAQRWHRPAHDGDGTVRPPIKSPRRGISRPHRDRFSRGLQEITTAELGN